jgi:hypothetical protein
VRGMSALRAVQGDAAGATMPSCAEKRIRQGGDPAVGHLNHSVERTTGEKGHDWIRQVKKLWPQVPHAFRHGVAPTLKTVKVSLLQRVPDAHSGRE